MTSYLRNFNNRKSIWNWQQIMSGGGRNTTLNKIAPHCVRMNDWETKAWELFFFVSFWLVIHLTPSLNCRLTVCMSVAYYAWIWISILKAHHIIPPRCEYNLHSTVRNKMEHSDSQFIHYDMVTSVSLKFEPHIKCNCEYL